MRNDITCFSPLWTLQTTKLNCQVRNPHSCNNGTDVMQLQSRYSLQNMYVVSDTQSKPLPGQVIVSMGHLLLFINWVDVASCQLDELNQETSLWSEWQRMKRLMAAQERWECVMFEGLAPNKTFISLPQWSRYYVEERQEECNSWKTGRRRSTECLPLAWHIRSIMKPQQLFHLLCSV